MFNHYLNNEGLYWRCIDRQAWTWSVILLVSYLYWHIHYEPVHKWVHFWPLLTLSLLSVSSCCTSLSSLSLVCRLCCRVSTFLTISCLCSRMATSSWASWGQFMGGVIKKILHCKLIPINFMFALQCSTLEACNKWCLRCTRFARCWSSPCLSFRALSMSNTSWVLSSNSLLVSLWNHRHAHAEYVLLNRPPDVYLIIKTNTWVNNLCISPRLVKSSECERASIHCQTHDLGNFSRSLLSTIFNLTFGACTCSMLQGA